MAGIRGRGFSTGKALSILFRLLVDGSQAKRQLGETSKEAVKEIRSVETLAQRALSVLSRPIRARFGWTGSLGISFLRENLRGLADKEINKVKDALGETEKAAKKVKTASVGAASGLTSVGAALLAIRSKPAAVQIQNLSKEYADATFAIKTFEGVLARTLQPDTAKKIKQFGPQVASGDTLKALLQTSKVTPSRVRSDDLLGQFGISFRSKDAEEALAEFQKGFNAIPDTVTRAAVAFRVFGADTARILPILEKTRSEATDAAKQFEEAAKKVAAMEQAQREVQEAKIVLSKKRAEALELETLAVKKAEAAEQHRIRATLFPLEQKAPTAGDLRAQASTPTGGKSQERAPDWLLKQLGLTDKGFDLEQVANMQKIEAQKVADVDRAAATLKHNEQLLAKSTDEFNRVHNLMLKSRGDIPRAVDDTQRVAQAIQRAKDEIIALEGQLEIVGSKAGDLFQTPWTPEVAVLENRIKKLREEIDLLNPALIKMNEREMDVKDTMRIAEKSVEDHGKVVTHDKNAVESARESLVKYQKVLAQDPVQKARTIDRLNVAGTQTQATEAAAAATAAKNIEDKAAVELLAKETIAAEATTAALGELGAVITLTAAETELLNKALKQTGGKGGTTALIDAVKQLNTFRAGPSGSGGGAIPPLDPTSIAKLESFLQKLGLLTTDAEKAAFAVESVGEAAAKDLLTGLGLVTPVVETTTTAIAGLATVLGFVAVGFATATVSALVFTGIAFLIAKKVASIDAVIGRLAEKTGIAAELISGLDAAARKAGLGGIKSIQERIGSFERILGQVAKGELPETAFLFKKLGIEAQAGGKNVNESLIKVVDAFNNMQDPGQRATLMQQAFADRTGKLGLALKAVGPDFQQYLRYLQENGRLLSEEGARGALEFNRQIQDMGEQFKAAGLQLGRGIIQTGAFQVGLNAATTEIYGFNTAMEDLGGIIGTTVLLLEGPFLAAAATIRTFAQGVPFGAPGFWTLWNSNMDTIIEHNKGLVKSEDEVQAEIDDTLKKEEMRAKTAVQLKEQERDARANIEQQITDQYKRQVDLRSKTRGDLAKQEITQTQDDAVEKTKVVLENMKRESQRTTDGTKEANDQKRANLIGYLNEVAKISNDSINKVQDIQVQEQIRLRDQEDQFHEDIIAAQKAWADERIDTLRFEADRNITTRKATLEKIKVIEEAQTALEMKELERRIAAAGKDNDLLRKLAAQRTEKTAQDQQRANQRQREIDQAGYDARLADLQLFSAEIENDATRANARVAVIQDAARRRNQTMTDLPSTLVARDEVNTATDVVSTLNVQIERLKKNNEDASEETYQLGLATADLATKQETLNLALAQEQNPLTLAKALQEAHVVEMEILNSKINAKKVEKALLESQGKDSRQAAADIKALETAKVVATQESGRAIRDVYIQQAQDLRSIMAETNSIYRGARQTQLQTDLTYIHQQEERLNISQKTRKRLVRQEISINIENSNIQHQANLEDIDNRKKAALDSSLNDDEWLAREEAFHQEREAEMRRHAVEITNIITTGKQAEKDAWEANDPFEQGLHGNDPFQQYLDRIKQRFNETGKITFKFADVGKMALNILGNAVKAFSEAVGSLVENWVLMGTTGPAAMRKMTASILAGLAKQAASEAIMELARGFAALAKAAGTAVVNPVASAAYAAEATGHFTSAAIFGGMAVGAAVSGRALAGDLFAEQSKDKKEKDAKAADREIKYTNEGRRQFVEVVHRVVVTGEKGFVARQFIEEIKSNNQEVRRAINTAQK